MNDLKIYRARVIEFGEVGNDMVHCRIIPKHLTVPENEKDNLPWFPPFIKGTVVKCKSEKDDGKASAECVWVVATEDFHFGYVLGLANPAGGLDGEGFGPHSYNYNEAMKMVATNGMDTSTFSYEDMQVVFFGMTKDGGILECYNFRTGDFYLITGSGTSIIMKQEQIHIRCGSPNELHSSIDLTPGNISMDADNIIINGKKAVNLGMEGMSVAMIPADCPPLSVDGISICSSGHITG